MRHPILSNSVRLIAWWLIWVVITLGQQLLFYYAYGSFTTAAIPDAIISLAIYSGIGLSLWYPFRYLNVAESKTIIMISNMVISGVISVILWLLITKYLCSAVLSKPNDYQAYWETSFPYRAGTGIFIYGLIVLTYYLFVTLYNLSEKNAKEARLESLVKETELKMLRSQINPHFLFISSLTITDPDGARDMVIKLSEFMRYSLSKKDEQPVSLRSELENLRLYLDIEKVRFGDRLSTEESIEENCLDIKMPVMILQPIYENAIKHGVYESTECVSIKTKVTCSQNYLEIVISNNYDAAPSLVKGTGTGLKNVSRRLDLFYNKKASIQTKKENGNFTVTIYIPDGG